MLKYYDVFVPGGFPHHTYNPRESLLLENQLMEVKENLCKLVTITGHTKSGKTVLTRKIISPSSSIWVDGGSIHDEDDFWSIIIDNLPIYQDTSVGTEKTDASTLSAKGSAGANFLVVKGQGEFGGSLEQARSTTESKSKTISSRISALQGLRQNKIPLIIDDFHYLPKELQGSIVRALKPLVFEGIPVIVIAIPHRRYDAIKVEREMTGRIRPISIPAWTEEELYYIAKQGFSVLGTGINESTMRKLAQEAVGSPHLMQEFCRHVAKSFESNAAKKTISDEDLNKIFLDVAETIGRPIFEKLARGPQQRTDRVKRGLKDGRTVDIYELVLHGLAHLKPGLVTLEYEDLRAGIREAASGQIPQLHEVTRVLKHMATIAATDQSSTPVIDFEGTDKKLHITDPFFAFYLRWGNLSR